MSNDEMLKLSEDFGVKLRFVREVVLSIGDDRDAIESFLEELSWRPFYQIEAEV